MGGEENAKGMLTPYRILDLTNERGYICGQLLGDLGADVIKIEKPGGDPGRSMGPFFNDIPDPEKSLYWFAFNTNKRGIMVYPFFTPREIMELSQLRFRNYWAEVDHPELETSITYPGSFFKTSEAFAMEYRRAPLIGEHNEEVYINELGLSKEELLTLKQARVI